MVSRITYFSFFSLFLFDFSSNIHSKTFFDDRICETNRIMFTGETDEASLERSHCKVTEKTAQLKSNHNSIQQRQSVKESKQDEEQSTVSIMRPRHLYTAYGQTRPSTSESDRIFYDGIYVRFRQSSSSSASKSGSSGSEFPAAEATASDPIKQRSMLM